MVKSKNWRVTFDKEGEDYTVLIQEGEDLTEETVKVVMEEMVAQNDDIYGIKEIVNLDALKVTDLDEALSILDEASQLEETEIGEYWSYLVAFGEILKSYNYMMPDELIKELKKEILSAATEINQNWEIKEEEVKKSFKYIEYRG